MIAWPLASRRGRLWISLATLALVGATGCGSDRADQKYTVAEPGITRTGLKCPPAGARLIVASKLARVFRGPGRTASEVFGCARRRGRPVLLGHAFDCFSAEPDVGSVSSIRLRGRLAAYSAQMCEGASPAGTVVRVMHLGERRLLLRASAFQAATSNVELRATDVEFGPRSSIVWIAANAADVQVNRAAYAERGCRSSREWTCPQVPVEPLDSGLDVAPDSLASSGGYVYWSRGGTPRSWAP